MTKTIAKRACAAALAVIAALLAPAVIAHAESGGTLPSGTPYSEVDTLIEEYISENAEAAAGVAFSLFDSNSVIYETYSGYADIENGTAADSSTVFEWGSATKLLVWVSAMQLYEQGELDLEADIRQYLPDGFLTNLNYDTPVTMLMLMNHTAGFQELYSDIYTTDESGILSLADALRLHEPEQIYEPGTVTSYSNWGAALAGYIVECISGMDFCEYVHQYILEPLGMEHTALAADLSDNAYVAEKRSELMCYTTDCEPLGESFYYLSLYPAGSCTSTLEDFRLFAQALLNENSALFQSPDTLQTLFTATDYFGDTDVPRNCHGFWVIPMGVRTVGHGGNTIGCSSYLLLSVESGIGATVMTNQSYETVYNEDMMELIFGAYSYDDYAQYYDGEPPSGVYRTARTIRSGALKIMSLSYTGGEWDYDEFWDYADDNGGKICYAYGDYLNVPTGVFALEMGLFFLWLVAVVFSALSLIVKPVRFLVRKLCRKNTKTFLGVWSTLSSFLQLVTLALIAVIFAQVSACAPSDTYVWAFVVFGVLALVMAGLIVYGAVKTFTAKASKRRVVYNITTVLLLLASVVNILYWNLFMFWSL